MSVLGAVYEKEWMESYLRIPYEQDADGESDERMFFHNEIKGILGPEHIMRDGLEYCRYSITGRKALTAMFQSLPIREWHLKKILNCLVTAIENAKEYMLCEDNLLLTSEHVFVDINDYTAEFLYLPGYMHPLRESLESFLEYLLNRVDYDDKSAVELIYDCYILVLKEEGGLAALKERLGENKAPEVKKEEQVKTFAEEKVSDLVKSWESLEEDDDIGEEPDISFSEWFKGLFRRKNINYAKTVVAEETEEYELKPVQAPQEVQGTVFLAKKKVGATPYLFSIADGSVVRLDKTPFCIGSIREQTGYTLSAEGVSRLHARLYSDKGEWHIADLNSTNGTFVNEQEVLPGRDCPLYNNDKIRFAGCEFLFKDGK